MWVRMDIFQEGEWLCLGWNLVFIVIYGVYGVDIHNSNIMVEEMYSYSPMPGTPPK